jgi:universal stress protein A
MDCSTADDRILGVAEKLAEGPDVSVTLVHVVHSHTLDQDRILREQAETCLQTAKDRFLPAAKVLLLSGEPEEELAKEIREGSYDLVAMGTHGHKGLSDLVLGSVSGYLKHEIDVPILMVKESERT